MSFEGKYNQIFELVKEDIESIKSLMCENISVIQPLNDEILNILNSPSKYIRSVVAILYIKALELDVSLDILNLLSAVELIHNASLIHDDVIDESAKRRDCKTLNSKFSSKLAVIAGDYILSIAMQKIGTLEYSEITEMFAKTLEKMSKAEINQYFSKFKIPTLEQYIEKSRNKTAELFKSALLSSIIVLGIEDDYAKDFITNFGIAFQIRDDLLNLSESADSKPVHNDIESGIYTAPVIFSGNKDRAKDGIEKTCLLLNNYIEKAVKSVENIEDNKYKRALIKLSKSLSDE